MELIVQKLHIWFTITQICRDSEYINHFKSKADKVKASGVYLIQKFAIVWARIYLKYISLARHLHKSRNHDCMVLYYSACQPLCT